MFTKRILMLHKQFIICYKTTQFRNSYKKISVIEKCRQNYATKPHFAAKYEVQTLKNMDLFRRPKLKPLKVLQKRKMGNTNVSTICGKQQRAQISGFSLPHYYNGHVVEEQFIVNGKFLKRLVHPLSTMAMMHMYMIASPIS